MRVDKRGSGHFEMIISFMFFVGFVFFLFVVLRPSNVSPISGAVVSGIYNSFEERTSANLSEVFLKVNNTGVDCFYVRLPGRIFSYALGDGDSYVTRVDGVDVDSGFKNSGSGSDGELNLDFGESFFRVAISPEFSDEDYSGCALLEDFELGSIHERRVISYSVLESMAGEYDSDYYVVKSNLRVPDIFDFAIVPESLMAVTMEPQSGVPDSVEVVAKDYVVEVLYENGTLINERFTFKIW